jgi:hypothetical protein
MEGDPNVLFEAAVVVCHYGPTLGWVTDHEMWPISVS